MPRKAVPERASGRASQSQNAPDIGAMSKHVWDEIEAVPGFNDRMRAAEKRLEAGGGTVYEVRGGALRKVRRGR